MGSQHGQAKAAERGSGLSGCVYSIVDDSSIGTTDVVGVDNDDDVDAQLFATQEARTSE